ncbi:MAG: D-tyrosyl-tRNA(Tyr) deacylase [Thaumarchaeota archaeon]|nr:MAG: D-tyrosyl-tRNA(Tyr) deacylase [Nitrososphaerota archaeon]
MQLLVAYHSDPAGTNLAHYISRNMKQDGKIYRGKNYDLVIIPTPTISADWLEEKYIYDGFVFLSKHATEMGTLALTCHSTGNFSEALFGGKPRQVAIPHPHLQKSYIQALWTKRKDFVEFEITIEATHHGPTALNKPALFIEVGTTEKQWNDKTLCDSVAKIVEDVMSTTPNNHDVAICFGGTHYPEKFNKELIVGQYALGTIIPKHALDFVDEKLFSHILERNKEAKCALVDWSSLGKNKQKVVSLIETTNLEMIRV